MSKKIATIILLVLLVQPASQGQDYTPEERYLQSRIEPRQFDRAKWADLVEGIDYTEKRRKPKEKATEERNSGSENNWPSFPAFSGGTGTAIAQFLLIVIGAVLIALLVRSMLGYGKAKDKKIKRTTEESINIQKIEENIHEADFDYFIRQAKEGGDFNLAIRLYYLAILKELSLRKAIKWKVDKTNRAYMNELRSSTHFEDFRSLTYIFEQTWYGNRPLDATYFGQIEPSFRHFIDGLTTPTKATAS